MTAVAPEVHDFSPHSPTVGSLLRAELLRIRSRRFAKWVVGALLAVMALVLVIAFHGTAKPTAQSIEQARAACQSQVEGGPDGVVIGGPDCTTIAQLSMNGSFDKDPAVTNDLAGGVIGVGVGVAVLGFIFGCTLGGADWSSRTMPALLFWEPRRARLFLVKMLAFAIVLVVLMLAAVVLWTALYSLLITVHGTWADGSSGVLGDMGGYLLRVALLDVCVGLMGFGLANITRNTGAALGVAFVTFAILDTFIRLYLSWFIQWQFTTNVGGLLADGGLDVNSSGQTLVHISVLRAAVVLVLYVVVVCGAAMELFRRRDVT